MSKKDKKMMPNGPKYGPDSVQNAAGDTARETIRKLDPSGFICRPPPKGLAAELPPPHPPRGATNVEPSGCASGKMDPKAFKNHIF